jgi:hypothetical protein
MKKIHDSVNTLHPSKFIWFNRLIEARLKFHIKSPLLMDFLIFGLPLDILFVFFLIARYQVISQGFVIPIIIVIFFMNFAPLLIWYYETRLMQEFFHKIVDLIPERKTLDDLNEKSHRFFARGSWIMAILWGGFLLATFLMINPLLHYAGVFGVQDPWYWVFLAAFIWLLYLHGVGLSGVMTTIMVSRAISTMTFEIDPMHKDKLGGLSAVGYYSIGTTLLFACGSLLIPVVVQFVTSAAVSTTPLFTAVSIYTIFILLSFLYPTLKINSQAKRQRGEILDRLKREYKELELELQYPGKKHKARLEGYFELNRIRSLYEDYRDLKLFPFKTEIIAQLVSSVLLPFVFILVKYYWFK